MPKESAPVSYIPNKYGIYLPLDLSKNQIRLLWIRPECEGPEIVCFLRILTIENAPKNYGCLSYCWGDTAHTSGIQLVHCFDDEDQELGYSVADFQVTTNLELALRRLRLKDRQFPIWIDALCINQSNIDERTHQVAFMRQIYSGASSVIIWLGESEKYSITAIRFAQMLLWLIHKASIQIGNCRSFKRNRLRASSKFVVT